MSHIKQDFVVFYSPGTFMSEETRKPIDSWNVEKAMEMAHDITERHGATPHGFRFVTYENKGTLNSEQTAKSNFYWLGGRIETLAEIEQRNDPSERILRSNMQSNGYDKVVVNDNSYRFTGPLMEGDVVLPFIVRRKETTS